MLSTLAITFALSFSANAETSLQVYGPGGPAPAMKACATAYEKSTGTKVQITAGPLDKWQKQSDSADLFYSGSENMMDSFTEKIPNLDAASIQTHYLRPSAILVRPKNPLKVRGIKDLVNKKMKIIVVNGAGQIGMWEDIVGGLKSAEALNKFRANIVFAAKNTGEAETKWKEDSSIDAWLVFNIWGTRNPDIADIVPTERNLTIYRSMGTAVAKNTKQKEAVLKFVDFVKSKDCRRLFEKEGWF
ncbi:substrate-binding domain-containing protein [Bdellovibrio bacteriovorus]|uniref:substrate-binding domain-containing protein n=1 Tax=Bdellovibrio bacteriovorus TaxID=959 RepID=UPI0021CF7AAD|nr:substrate-binding domain-containing protein [Bdellovibrio bacteriovorus]UXR63634.1 substrate-binding domain-containing protein [Bdellovibrio bacteriovorus]